LRREPIALLCAADQAPLGEPPMSRLKGRLKLRREVPSFGFEATPSSIMDMQTGTARPRRNPMAWVYLFVAGLFEVLWSFSMKQSDGFSRPVASALTLAGMIASVWLLALAMRTLPLGTSYMIWTGIGATGTFIVGIAVMGEAVSVMRIAAAAFIVVGIVLMKLSAPT
jgi:quaternary ammonium compound-resistance protein SugE